MHFEMLRLNFTFIVSNLSAVYTEIESRISEGD